MADQKITDKDQDSKAAETERKYKAYDAANELHAALRYIANTIEEHGADTSDAAEIGLAVILQDQVRRVRDLLSQPDFAKWGDGPVVM